MTNDYGIQLRPGIAPTALVALTPATTTFKEICLMFIVTKECHRKKKQTLYTRKNVFLIQAPISQLFLRNINVL